MRLCHPDSDDLAFLYGTIVTDGKDNYSADPTANICVFAKAQVINDMLALGKPHLFICTWSCMNLRRKQLQLGYKCSQVDRSPTGSGVTARVALQYHKGLIQLNQTRTFKSGATGSLFTGKPVEVPEYVSSVFLRKLPQVYFHTDTEWPHFYNTVGQRK